MITDGKVVDTPLPSVTHMLSLSGRKTKNLLRDFRIVLNNRRLLAHWHRGNPAADGYFKASKLTWIDDIPVYLASNQYIA